MGHIVKAIDTYIQEICAVREEISKVYDQQVRQKVTRFIDEQSQFRSATSGLRKHLNNLETNYCDLIEEG